MNIQNDGLPLPVYLAILASERPPLPAGEISVTELIAPARARALMRQHPDLPQPASRKLDALLGSGLHAMLDRGIWEEVHDDQGARFKRLRPDCEDWLVEQRLSVTRTEPDLYGQVVSGGIDLYIPEDGRLWDHKAMPMYSAWLYKQALAAGKDREEERAQQLNLYAHLLRAQGWPVASLRSFIYLKGWNRRDAQKMDLPNRWADLEVPLWPAEEAEAFLLARLRAHQDAERELPLCTPAETWQGRRCAEWCPAFAVCSQANPEAALNEAVAREKEIP
jgi:hypothetical protein